MAAGRMISYGWALKHPLGYAEKIGEWSYEVLLHPAVTKNLTKFFKSNAFHLVDSDIDRMALVNMIRNSSPFKGKPVPDFLRASVSCNGYTGEESWFSLIASVEIEGAGVIPEQNTIILPLQQKYDLISIRTFLARNIYLILTRFGEVGKQGEISYDIPIREGEIQSAIKVIDLEVVGASWTHSTLEIARYCESGLIIHTDTQTAEFVGPEKIKITGINQIAAKISELNSVLSRAGITIKPKIVVEFGKIMEEVINRSLEVSLALISARAHEACLKAKICSPKR